MQGTTVSDIFFVNLFVFGMHLEFLMYDFL